MVLFPKTIVLYYVTVDRSWFCFPKPLSFIMSLWIGHGFISPNHYPLSCRGSVMVLFPQTIVLYHVVVDQSWFYFPKPLSFTMSLLIGHGFVSPNHGPLSCCCGSVMVLFPQTIVLYHVVVDQSWFYFPKPLSFTMSLLIGHGFVSPNHGPLSCCCG